MLKVIDAKVENADESKRTYQLVLRVLAVTNRMYVYICKEENNKPKATLVDSYGRALSLLWQTQLSKLLSARGEELLSQVCELDKFSSKAAAGESLVF